MSVGRNNGPVVGVLSYITAAFVLILLSYALTRSLPGDFLTAMYSDSVVTLTADQFEELRSRYESRESFGRYLVRILTLNWGSSFAFGRPVFELILEALPWTLLLVGSAHLISMAVGFIVGVETAWRRGGPTEHVLVGGMTMLEGVPEIATGVLLLLIFALQLGWFPAAGAQTAYAEFSIGERIVDVGRHLALPLATLILAYLPGNFLLTRASMVLALKSQYVETARAKGLPPARIRYAHAARNALLPVVTRFGLRLAFMVTGALVVETIHSYPGLGTLLFNAIAVRDLPLIQGIVLLSALTVLFANLGLEYIYGLLDPRTKDAP